MKTKQIIGFVIKIALSVVIIGMVLAEVECNWWQNIVLAVILYGMISFIINSFLYLGVFGLIPIFGYVALTSVIDNMVILVILGIIIFGGSILLDIVTIKSLFG